jgi:hypothetical protein
VQGPLLKYVVGLVVFTLLAVTAWPYIYVYRLDNALSSADLNSLAPLIDMDAVRTQVKADIEKDVDKTVGDGGGRVMSWLKKGVKVVSDTAVDVNVDLQWVKETLNAKPGDSDSRRDSFMGDIDYAFYESLDTFIIRLGALDAEPVHVRLARSDQTWRVIAIFGR